MSPTISKDFPCCVYSVANFFIKAHTIGLLSDLTLLKLQQLLFFSQAWFVREADDVKLIGDIFYRRQYGFYVECVERKFSCFKGKNINIIAKDAKGIEFDLLEQSTYDFLHRIIEVYGNFSGEQLAWMLSQPDACANHIKVGDMVFDEEDFLVGKL